jgi:hypothetical protein
MNIKPLMRIELITFSLPRRNSTVELQGLEHNLFILKLEKYGPGWI